MENKYNIKHGYLSAYLNGKNLQVANKTWIYYNESTASLEVSA